MADWKQLLEAVEYRQKEPERQAANELRTLQMQALRDKLSKEREAQSFIANLNNPTSPERTETIPDEAVNASLSNASTGLSKFGMQLDPSLQGQATTTKTIPAQYLSDPERLEKMERYFAIQGDFDKAKALNEYRKQESQRMGFHQVFLQAYQAAGMDDAKTKELLIKQYGEGARAQLDNIEFTPAGVIQKNENLITSWNDGKPHNLKESNSSAPRTIVKKTADGKFEQTFEYNPKSPNADKYDIPIGEKHPVSSQVPHVTVNQPALPSADMDILADMLYEKRLDSADLSKRGGNQQIAAIYKRAEERHPGFDPRGNKAENAAFQATLIQQEKQRGAVGSFVKNINEQINTVYEIFNYLQRTDARALNLPLRSLKTRLAGSGLENKYDMFMSEISAESSKLSQSAAQSIAQLPEGSREKWEKIHDLNLPIPQMKILLEGTKHMGEIRLKSLDDEIIDTKNRRKASQGKTTPPSKDSQKVWVNVNGTWKQQ